MPSKPAIAELTPLVRRVVDGVVERCRGLAVGERLPAEAGLAAELAVSRSALRSALDHLAAGGLLDRSGRGTVLARAVRAEDGGAIADDEPLSKAEAFERYFLDAIAERRLKPGQRFTESELAEAAGVTTVTVREVLARYAARRLIAKDPRRSWRMITFDRAAIAELWDLRRLVEHHALDRLLATREAHEQAVEHLLAEHRAVAAQRRPRIARVRELDRRFHRLLFDACGNRYLDDLRAMIDLLIMVQLHDDEIGREGTRRALREHVAVLEAVRTGDARTARRALADHLDSSQLIITRAAARDPQ